VRISIIENIGGLMRVRYGKWRTNRQSSSDHSRVMPTASSRRKKSAVLPDSMTQEEKRAKNLRV
jgi:hypothetical protein